VKTMGPVRDLAQNYEVVAGTGEQCIPGDKDRCGDEGLATAARLFYPKGTRRVSRDLNERALEYTYIFTISTIFHVMPPPAMS